MKQIRLLGLAGGILASCITGAVATTTLGTMLTSYPQPSSMPSRAPSPTSAMPLYDDGTWLLFEGQVPGDDKSNNHLWIVNWDGTGLTDLLPDFYVWQHKIQPSTNGSSGRYVATIASYGWSDKFMFVLVHLPDGEIVANIPLTNPETELVDWVPPEDPNYEDQVRRMAASMSISDLRSLAWSPDGAQIAFSGAQDGTQADVYTYSLADGSVSRLTKGQHPHHASNLLWSPDGQYIAYDDISDYFTGFYWVDGIWVVRADGTSIRQIASVDEWPPAGDWKNRLQKLGWISERTIALQSLMTLNYAPYLLKLVNTDTGKSSSIFEKSYCGVAFAPEESVWLFESNSSDGEGAYLLRDSITSKIGPLACHPTVWSPELHVFITSKGLVETNGTHTMLDLPKGLPVISPNGEYWAYPREYSGLEPEERGTITTDDVLWIGKAGKQPQQISDAYLEVIQWSSNNQSVLVTDNNEGMQYVAMAPDFKLQLISRYDTSPVMGPWYYGEAIDNK